MLPARRFPPHKSGSGTTAALCDITGGWYVTLSQSAEDPHVSLVPAFPQVTGVALLAVGLWWKFMLGPYMLLISNSPSNAPYVLAGTGVAIVLFGLFGCFATCRGRPWMLKLVSR